VFVVGLFSFRDHLRRAAVAEPSERLRRRRTAAHTAAARRDRRGAEHAEAWTTGRIRSLAARRIAALERPGGGARRVDDKHPQNVFSLGLIAPLFRRAKIIGCHRDPRDNVLFVTRVTAVTSF
jgi:Sulfotransferase family